MQVNEQGWIINGYSIIDGWETCSTLFFVSEKESVHSAFSECLTAMAQDGEFPPISTFVIRRR